MNPETIAQWIPQLGSTGLLGVAVYMLWTDLKAERAARIAAEQARVLDAKEHAAAGLALLTRAHDALDRIEELRKDQP